MGALTVFESGSSGGDDPVFMQIAEDLAARNFSVIPNALPPALSAALFQQIQALSSAQFNPAGVGRDHAHTLNQFVRRDSIRWISGQTDAEHIWLQWAERLRNSLNQQLFLGLFSFESHFAHYSPGDFYKKHLDAFKTDTLSRKANRILSVVAYFNPGWLPDDGGELLIYNAAGTESLLQVIPAYATLAVFLSEEVPHEVLPARRDRYSIAGWFRSK
jgi:SM-20-related protein